MAKKRIRFLTVENNAAQTFAKWMAEKRHALRLTLDQLETKTGIKKQHLSTLERASPHSLTGKPVVPKRKTVEAIAKGLGADVNEALHAAGYTPSTSTHYVGGFEIQLPGDVDSIMLYTDIKDEADLAAFSESFQIAYEITKKRIAERDKK